MYYNSKNYRATIDCFKRAAAQRNAAAQYGLGKCYELGFGVKQDF